MPDSILIVDDERGIRETLSSVLRDEGFAVESVASGEECLEITRKQHFACI
ncbi:MAG: response regulator, partial [Pyrinomonadaceae bacterium]|nr:response regulator [Pyrinomonadaceae bacterium]